MSRKSLSKYRTNTVHQNRGHNHSLCVIFTKLENMLNTYLVFSKLIHQSNVKQKSEQSDLDREYHV